MRAGVLAVVLLAGLASCHGAAVELNNDNFDELVVNSGKNGFVKFLAPW